MKVRLKQKYKKLDKLPAQNIKISSLFSKFHYVSSYSKARQPSIMVPYVLLIEI